MFFFLNKKDIFEEKIKTTSIQCLFKNYMGKLVFVYKRFYKRSVIGWMAKR